MKKLTLLLLFVPTTYACTQTTITIGSTPVTVDTVYTGLNVPWEIIYGSDDHIWTTERNGIVSRINPLTHTKTVILDLSSTVFADSEAGLLGMALHPDFSTTPEVFLAYTYEESGNIRERIAKYTYDGTNLVNEETLLEDIPGNTTHIGARFLFLDNGTMLVSTGDAQNTTLPQNVNSVNGKILRVHTDGTIPADNPLGGSSYVYSFGHRNVQGIVQAPDGTIYLSEHGASSDDEFQVLEAGRNYGWPNVEGFCDAGTTEESFCAANNVKEPLTVWTPTIAPSDMVYYQNPAFPEFHERVLMAVLKDKMIVALELNATGTAVLGEEHYLSNIYGRLRDICVGPDNAIYLATNGQSWSNTDPGTHSILVLRVAEDAGVTGPGQNQRIQVHPNPVADKLTVNINQEYSTDVVRILDVKGTVLRTIDVNAPDFTINVESLPSGSYLIQVLFSDGRSEVLRFTK